MSGVPDSTDPSDGSTDEPTDDHRDASPGDRTTTVDVADLSVRNYDHDGPRRVSVTVRRREDGETVLAERFDVDAAGTTSADLPHGGVVVTVETDRDRDGTVCEVGPSPFESVLVEVGNGVVSVSQGF
jgi:hypothetical protein